MDIVRVQRRGEPTDELLQMEADDARRFSLEMRDESSARVFLAYDSDNNPVELRSDTVSAFTWPAS